VSKWWNEKARPWLKKNWWAVVLFPLGILIIINKVFRPHLTVVTSEISGAAAAKEEIDAEADKQRAEADAKRTERLAEVQEQHAETVAALTTEQAAKVEELLKDPEELNSFLLSVGKKVRGGPS